MRGNKEKGIKLGGWGKSDVLQDGKREPLGLSRHGREVAAVICRKDLSSGQPDDSVPGAGSWGGGGGPGLLRQPVLR